MAKVYNRLAFLKFAAERAKKHTGMVKTTAANYLDTKIVTAQTVNSVLARLNGFQYALMGGFALGFHGYQRATTDIDILVNEADIPNIAKVLGLQNLRPLTIGGTAGNMPDGTEVDLVAPDWPWVPEALATAQNTANGKVLNKQYLVMAKIWASRGTKDDMDSMQMLRRMTPDEQKATKKIVRRHKPEAVEDYGQLVDFAPYAGE